MIRSDDIDPIKNLNNLKNVETHNSNTTGCFSINKFYFNSSHISMKDFKNILGGYPKYKNRIQSIGSKN